MKKQVLLTSMLSLLAVSGAWAETVKNNSTQVTYSMTEISNETVTGTKKLGSSNVVTKDFETGIITITEIYNQTNNENHYFNGFPTSFNGVSLNLSDFETNDDENSEPTGGGTYGVNSSDYSTLLRELAKTNSNIVEMSTLSAVKGKYFARYNSTQKTTTWYEYSALPSKAKSAYAYAKYDDWDEIYYYYIINEVTLESKTYLKTKVNNYYKVTSLPTSFITSSISSLTLGESLTTIEEGAFENATGLNSITASGNFVVANNILYNSTRTALYFVLPAASESNITIPNSVTSIDANAFNNTHDMIVTLGTGCSTYAGGGTNNTFIGSTLKIGVVKNDMLTAGSYTIPAVVTTINAGAFKDASSLTYIDCSKNANFYYAEGILYNAAKTEVIAAIPGVATQTLPASVSTIDAYAFANTSKEINIYAAQKLTVGENQNNVTFIEPSATLIVTAAENGGYTVDGNVNDVNLAGITIQGTYMKFNGNILCDLNITNNSNTLLYFNTSMTVTGNNVINGDVCKNFVLLDNTADFYCPTSFTATNASYNRDIKNTWSTICLPFTTNGNVITNNYRAFSLTDYSDDSNTFTFTYASQLTAYVPYVIRRTADDAVALTFEGVSVPATSDAITSQGNAKFTGVMSPVTKTCDATNMYYGYAGGNMVRINGATLNPFRAYLTAPTANYKPVSAAATVRFLDEFTNEIECIETEATEIKDVVIEDIENNTIYNMNGQSVQKISTNGIYVVNGKKVMIK